MRVLRFRVSIIGMPKVYRIIELSENCTFDDFHEAIFQAFDRYDPHLYSFFLTLEDTANMRRIYDAQEITHPQNVEDFDFSRSRAKRMSTAETRIGDVDLKEKDVIHYLFDFGDDWWHRVRVQSVDKSTSNKKHVRLVKSVGASPPQYDYDEDDDLDE